MATGAAMGNSSRDARSRADAESPLQLDATSRNLAELVSANWPRVYRIAELVTGDEQIAQQMTGCVFLNDVGQQPARKWQPLDIVRCMLHRIERRFVAFGELAERPEMSEISSARVAHQLGKVELIAMLAKLPATERTLFVLYHTFEYSAEEIAGLLAMPESDVRQGAYSALLMAREVLADGGRASRKSKTPGESAQ